MFPTSTNDVLSGIVSHHETNSLNYKIKSVHDIEGEKILFKEFNELIKNNNSVSELNILTFFS